jgi:hypothetical protein
MDKSYEFSSTFSGSYELLEFVLNKYDLYECKVSKLVEEYNYNDKQRWGGYPKWWHYQGIPLRVWNLLHKDLTILSLSGLIEFDNLEQLRSEYESID